MKNLSRVFAVVLSTSIVAPNSALACLHGPTGKEQTSTVLNGMRTDRIRTKPDNELIVKIFVGPPGLKAGVGIKGVALDQSAAKIHERLADTAAEIDGEGSKGIGGGFQFEGSDIVGELFVLDQQTYPDWAAVRKALNISDHANPKRDAYYDKWLADIRSKERVAYAVKADLKNVSKPPMLAVRLDYTASADPNLDIIKDKILEIMSMDAPSITWFVGLSNNALNAKVLAAGAGEQYADKSDEKYFVQKNGFGGAADIRTRTWFPPTDATVGTPVKGRDFSKVNERLGKLDAGLAKVDPKAQDASGNAQPVPGILWMR